MRLDDIQVGVTYQLDSEAPTDQPDYAFGMMVGPAKVRDVFGMSAAPPFRAEVLAVRAPYKKGLRGVLLRATRQQVVSCICSQCGNQHVQGRQEDPIQYETETFEFTVYYTALLSLSDEIERHLLRERIQRKSRELRERRAMGGDQS